MQNNYLATYLTLVKYFCTLQSLAKTTFLDFPGLSGAEVMVKAHAEHSDSNRDEEHWDLKLNARLSHGSKGHRLPVSLFRLLPHHHIEAGGILVAKDEACVVVIGHCIHMEGSLKVHATECCVSYSGW